MKTTEIIITQPYRDMLQTITGDLQNLKLYVDSELVENGGKYSRELQKIPTMEQSLISLHEKLCFTVAMLENVSAITIRDEFDLSKIYENNI